jgi:hypothetical protein
MTEERLLDVIGMLDMSVPKLNVYTLEAQASRAMSSGYCEASRALYELAARATLMQGRTSVHHTMCTTTTMCIRKTKAM